jgi:hypothetical protein
MHWYDVAVGLPNARQLPAAHATQAADDVAVSPPKL